MSLLNKLPALLKAELTGTPTLLSNVWCNKDPPGGTRSPDTPGGGTPNGTNPAAFNVSPKGAVTQNYGTKF